MSSTSGVKEYTDVFKRENSIRLRENLKIEDDFPRGKLSKGTGNGQRTVVVACGSFSPPTYAHLRMFEMAKDFAKQSNEMDIIGGYFSACSDTYRFSKPHLAPFQDRLEMLRRSTADSTWVDVDPFEARQDFFVTTVVCLEHFEKCLNHDQKEEDRIRVVLLCGADLLDSFNTAGVWHPEDIRDILVRHGLIVIERTGTSSSDVVKTNPLLEELKDRIHLVPQDVPNAISSTRLRDKISKKQSIKYLTPDSVIQYINEKSLYLK
eukprot:TRINITY_DN4187_c0_g1_i1.p1 TRINITY_DN4187_c0_g1~~TRINITY_DN4187_c0_g1_i1.p1  ORF type:complete len:264 (-),score=83.31 TRINITY_DN4187_c0_g1_i1:8-799(-)